MVYHDQIRAARAAIGISLRQLAKESDLSTAEVHNLERGKGNPTVKTLGQICGALGISLAEVFDDERSTEWKVCPACSGRGIVRR